MAAPSQLALLRAVEVLNLHTQDLRLDRGYLDLVGDHERSPTGVAQRLMHSQVVPIVYQRWWRPAIGRVLKGPKGPSMAQEQRLARQLLAAKQDATVLDIACGPGNFTRRLATDVGKRGAVIGIDISPTMLTRAVNDTDVTQVVYVRADISNLSIRADSVDAVCCFAALHLFPDPWAALDVIARALVPSGRLAILTTVRPKRSFGALATNAFARVGGVRMFGAGELTSQLANRGLEVIYHRTFGLVQIVGACRSPTQQ